LKKTLENNIKIVKADKSKTMVLIKSEDLERKMHTFLQENNIKQINKDPTNKYQKQIQHTMQQCNTLVEKRIHKYIINMKPSAPQLNAYINEQQRHRHVFFVRRLVKL